MPILTIAERLVIEAQSFNIFGATNVHGIDFQRGLHDKFEKWRSNQSLKLKFTDKELSLLKPIIAQWLVGDQIKGMEDYGAYRDFAFDEISRMKMRTIHCLKVAKIQASAGSFNCEIAAVVLCLALKGGVTAPLEYINFSGVRDESSDTKHSFITLGYTDEEAHLSLERALFSRRLGRVLTAEEEAGFAEYVVCDAHHRESYPVTLALANAGQRLARYDDIFHHELPRARRFLYIPNPASLYDSDPDIRKLCDEIFAQRDNPELKNRVNNIFCEILLRPFTDAAARELVSPEKALRRAAWQGEPVYIRWIYETFHADVNVQDDNPEKRFTALHLAMQEKHYECVKILLELGADPHIENAHGVSVVQLMRESDAPEMQALSEKFVSVSMRQ